MKPTKILLLGATLDSDNRGIGALAMGALAILLNRYPGCDIRFVDYGRSAHTTETLVNGETVSIGLVNLRFSWKPWLPNNIVWLLALAALSRLAGGSLRRRIAASNAWLKQLAEADVAVAISGGDSFSDIYGLPRFLYMVLPQLLIIALGRPLVLLPQTIGPMKTGFAKRVARYIIDHSEIVYSREVDGVNGTAEVLNLGKSRAKLRFGYDMGFVLEPRRPQGDADPGATAAATAPRPLVGVNVSGLLSIGGYDGKNTFALRCDYLELVERLIVALVDVHQADVLLVPHVFGSAAESDIHAINAIFDKLKGRYPTQLSRVERSYDQGEIKYLIGQCDLFVGSRMHACIAALSQSVPAVAVAYSQKFAGVLESIGVGHLVADPRRLDIDAIVAMVGDAFSKRASIRTHLSTTMPRVRADVLNMLADVA